MSFINLKVIYFVNLNIQLNVEILIEFADFFKLKLHRIREFKTFNSWFIHSQYAGRLFKTLSKVASKLKYDSVPGFMCFDLFVYGGSSIVIIIFMIRYSLMLLLLPRDALTGIFK